MAHSPGQSRGWNIFGNFRDADWQDRAAVQIRRRYARLLLNSHF
jgi:hypothetical protein